MTGKKLRRLLAVLSILVFAVFAGFIGSPTLSVQPAAAQSGGQVPGGWSGSTSDAEFWRAIRKGVSGTVSIPDKKAAQLVQSDGDELRAFRNGKMASTGVNAMIIVVLVLIVTIYFLRKKLRPAIVQMYGALTVFCRLTSAPCGAGFGQAARRRPLWTFCKPSIQQTRTSFGRTGAMFSF